MGYAQGILDKSIFKFTIYFFIPNLYLISGIICGETSILNLFILNLLILILQLILPLLDTRLLRLAFKSKFVSKVSIKSFTSSKV